MQGGKEAKKNEAIREKRRMLRSHGYMRLANAFPGQ